MRKDCSNIVERVSTIPIKVARVIARLNTGGPAIHAISLAKELPQKGFDCRLYTGVIAKDEEDMSPVAVKQGIQLFVIPELSREISLIKDVQVFIRLFVELRKFRPDILHTHTAKAGTIGRLVALFVRIPVRIHTFHGHVFHGYFGNLKTHIFLWIERMLALFTDCLVVLCQSQKKELVDTYRIAHERKVHIVPLGFDFSSYPAERHCREEKRREWQLTSTQFVYGFVGRLVHIKNPGLFVQAVELLFQEQHAKQEPDTKFDCLIAAIIVGGGILEGSLSTLITEQALNGKISLVGWQSDMANVYAALDVVVLTSLNEGTPVALIEAMAASKPFISTNVGGVKDLMAGKGSVYAEENGEQFIVYDNGILVESQNVESLCAALRYLANHQEHGREMGRIGRSLVLQNFGLDRLVSDVHDLYVHVLANKGILVSDSEMR